MEQTLSNDRQIAYHRQQINPDIIPDTKLTFAYDDNKYIKLCTEIAGESHDIYTEYNKESGTGHLIQHIKPSGRDSDLVRYFSLKMLRCFYILI